MYSIVILTNLKLLEKSIHRSWWFVHSSVKFCGVIVIQVLCLMMTSTHAHANGGWIDFSQEGRYSGWACRFGTPSQVGIHILRGDGVFLGGGNAALPRELGVRNACGSSHSSHGFDIRLSIPERFRDGRTHKVHVYAVFADGSSKELNQSPAIVAFSLAPNNLPAPNEQGSVVGRDLDMSPQGLAKIFGHLGLWDGERVFEMLVEGNANRVKSSTWDDFRSRTEVWPSINPSIPKYTVNSCLQSRPCHERDSYKLGVIGTGFQNYSSREAVVRRAKQIFEIGANYTTTTGVVMALTSRILWSTSHCNPFSGEVCNPKARTIPAQIGLYRCDTFVVEVLASSILPERHPYGMLEIYVNGRQRQVDDWGQKMRALVYNTTYLPSSVYNRWRIQVRGATKMNPVMGG